MSWWVGDLAGAGRYIELISWIFWVLLSVTLHELAHGWAAIWQGDDTPVRLNRMTANPVVHMGPQSLIMFALCGIAWGMMPVNPYNFRNRRWGDVYVSAAGPAMNLLLAAVCLVLVTLWLRVAPAGTEPLYRNGAEFLFTGMWLNLILAVLNLLPIPPLDGSKVLSGFSSRARALFEHPQAGLFGMFAFIVIFFMSPIGSILFGMAWGVATTLTDAVGSLVGNPGIREVLWVN
jgi:Zn-dependent protease